MKRSEINLACRQAGDCFRRHGWTLPPRPLWDITDFGLGDFARHGLTLVNLANEPEYCEKLMYARRGQTTPAHTHAKKKEDIICRAGELTLELWPARPGIPGGPSSVAVAVNGEPVTVAAGARLVLPAGSRVTLVPGVWHAFSPSSDECIIGEVSTANDDLHDNFFLDPDIGRFPGIEEDEPAAIRLVSDR
ncbi:MAG TPA: D-lyxose/D-mannose family sugar isomerase [Rariglobus sp.]